MNLGAFQTKLSHLLKRCCGTFATAIRNKNLKDMPGPKQLPVLGNSLLFSPLGPYTTEKLLVGFSDLQKQFGEIVKMKMGNQIMVLLFNPEDVRTMFHHEGQYPKRPTLEALKKYRKEHYGCAGVVPEDGEEWYRLRHNVLPLLRLQTVHSYWSRQRAIAKEFASSLSSKTCPDGIISDFLHQAFLYSLEAIGVVSYGKRLNCLSSNSAEGVKIAQVNVQFLKALGHTFHNLPWWKLWKTRVYKNLGSTQDFMMKIAVKYLDQARQKYEENPENLAIQEPFLFHLLDNKHLLEIEVNLLITEIFQGGIDATATTITMMLHHLARNPVVQEAIYVDLKGCELEPGKFPPLLRACLKETMRLNPSASANSRILDTDAILSGYHVPKGTLVIGVNPVISRMNRHFTSASKFDPWRWLAKETKQLIHPYSVLPFGHGARMCPGRWIAEQEILLCISEIILKYQVLSFNANEIEMVLAMNLVPNETLNFGIITR